MSISANVDLCMIAVLLVLVKFVPIPVDGVLDVLPSFSFRAAMVGLKEGAAVPLIGVSVLPPYDRYPFPIRLVSGVVSEVERVGHSPTVAAFLDRVIGWKGVALRIGAVPVANVVASAADILLELGFIAVCLRAVRLHGVVRCTGFLQSVSEKL